MTFAIVHPPCLRGAALFLAHPSQGERIVRLRGNLDHGLDKVEHAPKKRYDVTFIIAGINGIGIYHDI
jgi:hypothetical protein